MFKEMKKMGGKALIYFVVARVFGFVLQFIGWVFCKRIIATITLFVVLIFHVLTGALFTFLTKPVSALAHEPQATESIGLESMENFARLPYFRNGAQAHQVSSHDPTGDNVDLNNYLYVDEHGVDPDEYFIMDVESPGSIYRSWYVDGDGVVAGRIKFYFDGEATPSIDMDLPDFFSGSTSPFLSPLVGTASGGFFNYVPMPFAQSVRVSLTNPGTPFYYNINYYTYTTNTGITTFTGAEDSSSVQDMWTNVMTDPKSTTGNITLTDTVSIGGSGASATIANIAGTGSINSIKFNITPNDLTALSNTKIKMYWDDEITPSVEVPFGMFFGSGLGERNNLHALPLGIDNSGDYYCYFPMPYNRSARIVITNEGASAVSLFYEVQYNTTPYIGLGDSAGYFKAQYESETPTTLNQDYIALNLSDTKGHFVGLNLTMDETTGAFYEGDERIYIDGSQTPQIYGTGTEDFFNGGYIWGETSSKPVHGCTVFDDGGITVAAYRYFLSDAIPFYDSIKVGIEHGPINDAEGDYSSVAFYYALPQSGFSGTTDSIDVGNDSSEASHSYTINGESDLSAYWFDNWGAEYQYEGDDNTGFLDDGRAFTTYSQFNITIDPENQGIKLRRRLDYSIGQQKSNVYVDGDLVDIWYDGGGNSTLLARDSDFEIPKSFTENKSTIIVKVEFISSFYDWNEMYYWAYSYIDFDNTVPTENSVSVAGGDTYSGSTANLTLSSTDTDTGLGQMQFSNDDITYSDWEAYSETKSGWTLTGDDGLKTVYAKFRDFAGNESTAVSDTIILDNTFPSVTVTGLTINRTGGYIDIEGTASDTDGSGVASITVNGNSVSLINLPNFSYRLLNLAIGSNGIEIFATDVAGNESQPHLSFNVIYTPLVQPGSDSTTAPATISTPVPVTYSTETDGDSISSIIAVPQAVAGDNEPIYSTPNSSSNKSNQNDENQDENANLIVYVVVGILVIFLGIGFILLKQKRI